jgi:hypothetical protein
VGQHQRIQHRVEDIEHPAESSRQPRAALLGRCLSQELNWADRHAWSEDGGVMVHKEVENGNEAIFDCCSDRNFFVSLACTRFGDGRNLPSTGVRAMA